MIEYLEPRLLGSASEDVASQWQQHGQLTGDLNGDLVVDILDAVMAARGIVAPKYDGHAEVSDGVLNVWATEPSDLGPYWIGKDINDPKLENIRQGPLADCYALSAAGALDNTGKPISISSEAAGYAVVFAHETVHVSFKLSLQWQPQVGNCWGQVFEKAWAWERGQTPWGRGQNSLEYIQWGNAPEVWDALGIPSDLFIFAQGGQVQTAPEWIGQQLAQHQAITFPTSSIAVNMVPSHEYVVSSVTGEGLSAVFVLYNPWGFYETHTFAEMYMDGIGRFFVTTLGT